MTFHPDSLPDLTGKVYIVTGGTSGIGYFTVARLAQHNAHVYLCARSAEKGNTAITDIKKLYPQANITPLVMDHMSLSSVVSAAKLFLANEPVLHGLVNNAGCMATPFDLSKDGHEDQWQTNYLAHWVFTSHLLPLLLHTSKTLPSGSVRIVNLTSGGHGLAPSGGISFTDPNLANSGGWTRYGQSKVANILHAKTLNKLYGPVAKSPDGEIWTSAVHPGIVDTRLVQKSAPGMMLLLAKTMAAVGMSVDGDTGAWTSVYCVASPDMKKEHSGHYFTRIANAGGYQTGPAKDMKLAEKLEEWTRVEMKKEGWVQ